MESTMEKEKIWYELRKIYQNNVVVATFTTLLHVTLKNRQYLCDGCFFCKIYQKDSKGLLTVQIIKTTKESFRTVSCYFYKEAEEYLNKTDLNEKFGWIY